MKPNKLHQWTARLSGPIQGYWKPSDTILLRKTANNTRCVYTKQEIEVLLYNANNLPHGPLPVNGHHEDKAFKFWRDTMSTGRRTPRDTVTTRQLNETVRGIVLAYLDWHTGHHGFAATDAKLRPFHAFNGLHDNTDENTLRYWGGVRRSVFPVWRMIVPGAGFIDYVNIPWQSIMANGQGGDSLRIIKVGGA